jgi:uncharacterized protein (TIGR00251 family)
MILKKCAQNLCKKRQLMNISNFVKDGLLKIKVIPNSKKEKLVEANGWLKLYLKAVPEKGKANKEVIRFFKKEIELKVEIKSGEKSRDKVLRILK